MPPLTCEKILHRAKMQITVLCANVPNASCPRPPNGALPLDYTGDFRSPSLLAALSGNASVYGCFIVTTSAARQTPGGPGTRDTDSWLDDTDKNLVPICLYCLKYTKFGQLIFRKIIEIVATRCQN